MLTHLHWTYPWVLWALPIAVLPLLSYAARTFSYPAIGDWPRDIASEVLQLLMRATGALTLAALVVASAAPYLEGGTQTLSGTGAEIVIVLDRSGSMSEPLLGEGDAGSIRGETHGQSKIEAARRILLAFMQRRPGDTFGMVTFNASPIGVAPLGEDRALVESALKSAEARSEGYTSPARALGLALDYFRDRPLTAARVVLLVSDGGATISAANRAKVAALFRERQASLIWIYTRGEQEPSIRVPKELASQSLSMHEFFASLSSPYEMFEVVDSQGLARAVAEVGRMTNLPTRYEQRLPRRDLGAPLFVFALACILALLGTRLLEVQSWPA
jgi:mxaC protein